MEIGRQFWLIFLSLIAIALVRVGIEVLDRNLDLSQALNESASADEAINNASLPWIFLITPSKRRLSQRADLTRLAQTVSHLSRVHWILVEDAEQPSKSLEGLLKRSGVAYTHLAIPKKADPKFKWSRGMVQRNLALKWLREAPRPLPPGLVYFMDDDNSYDLRLFHWIRKVKSIGVWAVGFAGNSIVEAPKQKNGKFSGWNVHWAPKRLVADMACFAVNLDLILGSNATFHSQCIPGYFESCFVKQLGVNREDIQVFGLHRKEVLVWHVRTTLQGNPQATSNYGYQVK